MTIQGSKRLQALIDGQTSDSLQAQRRRLLNVMLLATGVGTGLTLLVILAIGPTGQAGAHTEINALRLAALASLGGILIAYFLNRHVSSTAAGALFLLLLIVGATTADEAHQVVNGRGLLTFAVPILAASVVMPPWTSFAAAGLSSAAITVVSLTVEHAVPNVPAIILFFLLALIAYLSAHSLEQRLQERRAAEAHTKQVLARQTATNQLALALGNASDVAHIHRTLYQHIHQLMDSTAFIVSFYDPANRRIRAGYVINEEQELDPADFPPIPLENAGHGTQSQVIRNGEPLYVADYRAAMETVSTEYTIDDSGTVSEGPPPSGETVDVTRSALYAPMKIEGKTIGVIQVQSHRRDAYSEDDIQILSSMANLAAIAIQNARLFSSLEQSNETLETHRDHLEELVSERTAELQQTVNLMTGREIRMAELKDVIRQLRAQLADAGLRPIANDPLLKEGT